MAVPRSFNANEKKIQGIISDDRYIPPNINSIQFDVTTVSNSLPDSVKIDS